MTALRYTPAATPADIKSLRYFLQEELVKIQNSINSLADGSLQTYHVEPSKPRDGDIVLADGTDWNPGLGQGVYIWFNDQWNKLWGGPVAWDDLRFPATVINPQGGASDPDRNTNTGLLLFDSGVTELVFLAAQLPHQYKEGSDLSPHVHWMKTTSATGSVYWQLEYKWVRIGEVMDASWTTIASYTPTVSDSDTANKHAITPFSSISGTNTQISDMLIMKLSRIGGDTNDTYGDDAELLEFDIHYEIDHYGSIGAFDKDGV